jgi:hypothetical protein
MLIEVSFEHLSLLNRLKGGNGEDQKKEKKVNGFSGLIASIILGGLTMHGDEY